MREKGFTLVELMIVVVIVGVLAVVAIFSIRKFMAAGRKSEVYAMFGEIRAKEEAYHAEFSAYASTTNSEAIFYPVPNGTPQTWAPPLVFTQIGINPGKNQVYCGYNVIAGARGSMAGMGARGTAWFGNAAPLTDWWYANASCDNDRNPAINALYITSNTNTAVNEQNPQN